VKARGIPFNSALVATVMFAIAIFPHEISAQSNPVPPQTVPPRPRLEMYQVRPETDVTLGVWNGKESVYGIGPGEYVSIYRNGDRLMVYALDQNGKQIPNLEITATSTAYEVLTGVQAKEQRKVYVDRPDGENLVLDRAAGEDPINKLLNPGTARADNRTPLPLKESVLRWARDPDTGEMRFMNFYGVQTKKAGIQWANSDAIAYRERTHKPADQQPGAALEATGPCTECVTQAPLKPPPEVKSIAKIITGEADKAIEELVDKVFGQVGSCVHNGAPTPEVRKKLVDDLCRADVSKFPKKADGKPFTNTDLLNIGLLTRTQYGEMGGKCLAKGEEYGQAVTKVILNRLEYATVNPKRGRADFIRTEKYSCEDDLSRVMLNGRQFNVWLDGEKAGRWALCPPSAVKQKFFGGNIASADQVRLFRRAVKNAVRAVVTRDQVKTEWQDFKSLYYTSNLERPKLERVANPSINGMALMDPKCMMVYNDPKNSWRP
jgi:hypothetical protein